MHKTCAQRQPVNISHLDDTTFVMDLMSSLRISGIYAHMARSF